MAASTLTFADGTTRPLAPGEGVYPVARVTDGAWALGAAWCLPGVACVTPGGRIEGVASADAWPSVLPGVRFGGWDPAPAPAPFTPPPWGAHLYGVVELTRLRVLRLAAWGLGAEGGRAGWGVSAPAPMAPVEAGVSGRFGVGLASGDVVVCRVAADAWGVAVMR